eukprot:Sdes_comp9565_c0_seq1m1042
MLGSINILSKSAIEHPNKPETETQNDQIQITFVPDRNVPLHIINTTKTKCKILGGTDARQKRKQKLSKNFPEEDSLLSSIHSTAFLATETISSDLQKKEPRKKPSFFYITESSEEDEENSLKSQLEEKSSKILADKKLSPSNESGSCVDDGFRFLSARKKNASALLASTPPLTLNSNLTSTSVTLDKNLKHHLPSAISGKKMHSLTRKKAG